MPIEQQDVQASELEELSVRFMAGVQARQSGDIDGAEDAFRAVIRAEPRLAEPHMELARVLLDTGRIEEAEPHAREALGHLEVSGVWTDDVPEDVVRGLANALLAEVLRQRAGMDEVIFGPPEAFESMLREARERFTTAAALDPTDEYSRYHATFLGHRGSSEP